MNTHPLRFRVHGACAIGVLTFAIAGAALADPPAGNARSAQLGAAVPGGAIVSARSVILTPTAGGDSTAVPLGQDGAFSATGLAPGHYTLRVTSVTVSKQTQGASFGEKVNAGLHAAGGALASGAQRDMPSRISMNLTVPKQGSRRIDVDGEGAPIEVSTDGAIAGIVVGVVVSR